MRHDDTRIYQTALELVRFGDQVVQRFPPGYAFLRDQIRRASSSVPLNFAEGFSKKTRREQHHYFRIARASAHESSAAFDVSDCLGIISTDHLAKGKDLCDHLAAMITRFMAAPGPATP